MVNKETAMNTYGPETGERLHVLEGSDADGFEVVLKTDSLSDAVARARKARPSGIVQDWRGVVFNRYPDADIEWESLVRAGLVPWD
jgi:hypothetical protein